MAALGRHIAELPLKTARTPHPLMQAKQCLEEALRLLDSHGAQLPAIHTAVALDALNDLLSHGERKPN